jgi:hypothetical protein
MWLAEGPVFRGTCTGQETRQKKFEYRDTRDCRTDQADAVELANRMRNTRMTEFGIFTEGEISG